ncbi:hypothetical protein Pan216_50010 [Planctomycetes bacterium Pan216]|uniref:Peptidase C39 domain-containing protein n=1 Tax=Kolteria novifilia TaxID=2527975 RepID=A0A518BAW0_9BACT|nr:hypothetical protein Pan216_50010 [Planctomycetes bacterium Pan216]
MVRPMLFSLVTIVLLSSWSLGGSAARDDGRCAVESFRDSLALLGAFPNDQEVMRFFPDGGEPFSLADVDFAATSMGFQTLAVRWDQVELAEFPCPAILHVRRRPDSGKSDHFVVCAGRDGDNLCIINYPGTPQIVSIDSLGRRWSGVAMYLDVAANVPISHRLSSRGRPWWNYGIILVGVLLGGLICQQGARWRASQSHSKNHV